MEFKSLFFNGELNKIKHKPQIMKISNDFDVVEIDKFDDDFLCFRIERYQNASKYGVESKDNCSTHVSLKEELDKRDIFLQDFIIIDQHKKDIYYTGSKANVESIVKVYLNISKGFLSSRVSLENLACITEIKVIEYPEGQSNVFVQGEEFQVNQEITDIFCDPNPCEKIIRSYQMRKGLFHMSKLEHLVREHATDKLRKYTVEGMDKDGHFMKYSDGIFAVKYDILTDEKYKNYDVRKNLTLEQIKEELKKVVNI